MSVRTLFASLILMLVTTTTSLADEMTTFVKDGVAIRGADAVAYFTEGAYVSGTPEFTTTYDDVTWQFSSAENRDLFAANPEKYAPQFGGHCAVGAARGRKVSSLPNMWRILDGRLYLAYSPGLQKDFDADPKGIIAKATENWATVKFKNLAM